MMTHPTLTDWARKTLNKIEDRSVDIYRRLEYLLDDVPLERMSLEDLSQEIAKNSDLVLHIEMNSSNCTIKQVWTQKPLPTALTVFNKEPCFDFQKLKPQFISNEQIRIILPNIAQGLPQCVGMTFPTADNGGLFVITSQSFEKNRLLFLNAHSLIQKHIYGSP